MAENLFEKRIFLLKKARKLILDGDYEEAKKVLEEVGSNECTITALVNAEEHQSDRWRDLAIEFIDQNIKKAR